MTPGGREACGEGDIYFEYLASAPLTLRAARPEPVRAVARKREKSLSPTK